MGAFSDKPFGLSFGTKMQSHEIESRQLSLFPALDCAQQSLFCPLPVVTALRCVHLTAGGSAARLIECDDRHRYVVKTLQNAQTPRVLANEVIATRLAARIGLPVAPMALVRVTPRFAGAAGMAPEQVGLAFGSRTPVRRRPISDLHPEEWAQVRNLQAFWGFLLFDLWTANHDRRQVVFERRGRGFRVFMIDQGYCFNAGRWADMPASFFPAFYSRVEVYKHILGWHSFEPYLGKLERLRADLIAGAAEGLPAEWVDDAVALKLLLRRLGSRVHHLREWITVILLEHPDVFPGWVAELQRKSPWSLLRLSLARDSVVA
jgi:hypothetical protein